MRWPFGPPHLTLKPSKKNKTTNEKIEERERERDIEKTNKEYEKQSKNTKIPKMSFQLSFNFFLFLVGVQNFPFLTTWSKTRAPPNTIKIGGVSEKKLLKNNYASRNGHLWTQKTKLQKFQLSFILSVFFSFNNKKHKHALKPLFYGVLAK